MKQRSFAIISNCGKWCELDYLGRHTKKLCTSILAKTEHIPPDEREYPGPFRDFNEFMFSNVGEAIHVYQRGDQRVMYYFNKALRQVFVLVLVISHSSNEKGDYYFLNIDVYTNVIYNVVNDSVSFYHGSRQIRNPVSSYFNDNHFIIAKIEYLQQELESVQRINFEQPNSSVESGMTLITNGLLVFN